MYYKRKAYHKLLDWKQHYSDKYAILLEGARRPPGTMSSPLTGAMTP